MSRTLLAASLAGLCFAVWPVVLPQQPKQKEPKVSPPTAQAYAAGSAEKGQRVFRQNCARCHEAPTGFPEQISGTVLRHMRIRASLSQREEEELMRFLNP